MRTAKPVKKDGTIGKVPRISVIVPIFNVEKYVRKCLESLVNQTMKEIEVICIDDGSTDGSGRIADEYVRDEFPIFRVIHTENRGLSAARNRGIDEAVADWLMFVDSDDWVSEDFCRIPYEAASDTRADLVIFDAFKVKGDEIKTSRRNSTYPTGIVDEATAQEYGGIAAWKKMYKRDLLQSVRFPEGHVYEEIMTTHKFIHNAKRIVCLPYRLYYYVERPDSITHMHTYRNVNDYFLSTLMRYDDLISYGFSENKIKPSIYASAIWYLSRTKPKDEWIYEKAVEILDSCQSIPRTLSFNKKIALIAWKINRRLFYFLSKFSGRLEE